MKTFHIFCLLLGEGLLFGALGSWVLWTGIFLATLWIVYCPSNPAAPLPEPLLKKAKIALTFLFWASFFYTLHAFVQSLSCLNCMQGIQRANARHFWDEWHPSVWVWAKNVYSAYPQPVLILLILGILVLVYVLTKRKK